MRLRLLGGSEYDAIRDDDLAVKIKYRIMTNSSVLELQSSPRNLTLDTDWWVLFVCFVELKLFYVAQSELFQ